MHFEHMRILKISIVSTLVLGFSLPTTAQAKPNSPECRFKSDKQTITDNQCDALYEGSLDAQYGGRRTLVPKKATVTWSDGVKTNIMFKEILEFKGAARYGTAIVDGYTYQFIGFGSGGYSFSRIDPKTAKEKTISINKWTGRFKQ
jgi:hypothetical protein